MPPVGFEPTISAGERSQTYALDRAAFRIGWHYFTFVAYVSFSYQGSLWTERVPFQLCLEYMGSWICRLVHCNVGGELHLLHKIDLQPVGSLEAIYCLLTSTTHTFVSDNSAKFFRSPIEDGTDRLSWNVGNYRSTLLYIPEERRSHFLPCFLLLVDRCVAVRQSPLQGVRQSM
jgi:hypothetical protein